MCFDVSDTVAHGDVGWQQLCVINNEATDC